MQQPHTSIAIYRSQNGEIEVSVTLGNNTVGVSANQMSLLFCRDEKTIR